MPRNLGAVGTFGPTVSALPTSDLFDGRTCVFGGVGYIVEAGAWTVARGGGGGGTTGYDTAPLGSLMWWSGKTAPSAEYVLANGQTLNKATFPDGYAYAATEAAAGNANWSTTSTTFRVPDLRDRFLLASGANAIGTRDGTASETLTIGQIPSHVHKTPFLIAQGDAGLMGPSSIPAPWWVNRAAVDAWGTSPRPDTDSAGGNGSHNNMPPYVALALYVKVAGVSASAEVITGPTGPAGAPGEASDVGDIKASAALRPPSSKWLRLLDGMTLSRTAYPELFAALTGEATMTMTAGSPVATVSPANAVWPSMTVEGPGLQAATLVLAVAGGVSVTLNKVAQSSGSARVIRTLPYGGGDGSTTFGLPSPAGRAVVAAGAGSGLTARNPGTQWGTETHTLTANQLAQHAHSLTATTGAGADQTGTGTPPHNGMPTSTARATGTMVSSSTGAAIAADQAHPNTQPSVALPLYIRVSV